VGRSACDRKGTVGRKKYGRRRILVSWHLQSARVLRKNGAMPLGNRRSGSRDEDNSRHVPPERYKLRKLALRCHRVSRLICKLDRRLRVNSAEVCREETYRLRVVNSRISYSDFVKTFTHLEVVHLDAETSRDEPSLHSKHTWQMKLYQGSWRRGVTAGGCRNNQGMIFMPDIKSETTV